MLTEAEFLLESQNPIPENGFYFRGEHSADFHLYVERYPSKTIPNRRVTSIAVQGRSGLLYQDDGIYEDVLASYDCYFHGAVPMPEQLAQISGWLSQPGFHCLRDHYDPEHYCLATFLGPANVSNILNRYGRCTIQFTRHPQRWRLDGIYPIPISVTPNSIANPTAQVARPRITVYGDGAGVLTVNGTAVTIHALSGELTLDCDTLNAYRQPGEGGYVNCNGDIYAPEFPVLSPGDNAISWSGGVTGIEIVPRWWDL